MPFGIGAGVIGIVLFAILLIIVLVLKGYALWTAARLNHKWWFIILLIINTIGILELIYLYFVAKKWRGVPANSTPKA
ncbi:hypothetical protein KGQ27_03845 [Patescibacteria group bacterium]|nr:hypothetical protein [Patescibacteria group bacterium]MDE2011217.1 hypothetical protein [Patescibacteria group bacterium]